MLDHMIFNRLKWFNISGNANEVAANNKIWLAVPNKLVLRAGSSVDFLNDLNTGSVKYPKIMNTVTVHCIGATKDAYFLMEILPGTIIMAILAQLICKKFHMVQVL